MIRKESDMRMEITLTTTRWGTTLIAELLAKELELSERQRLEITRLREHRRRDREVNRYRWKIMKFPNTTTIEPEQVKCHIEISKIQRGQMRNSNGMIEMEHESELS